MKMPDVQSDDEVFINIVPLIDVAYFLLIFFLGATTFAQIEREQGINLPGSESPQPLSAMPKELIINISNEGLIKISGKTCTLDELGVMLTDIAKTQGDRDILVRADKDSRHEYFARVVDTAHKAGINKTKIGYIVRSDQATPIPLK